MFIPFLLRAPRVVGETIRRPCRRRAVWALLVAVGVVVVVSLGVALAVGGADLGGCFGGGGSVAGPKPSLAAVKEIPRARLRLYQLAGRRFDIDWSFLAAIGYQECRHGSCGDDNGYGCGGAMQISFRRGSPCSPGSGPTLWDTYGTDGDGDGDADINSPVDSVFTAAKVLRRAKRAPATGGSYTAYRRAACNYYGACASYADEVMARAVEYGFRGAGSPHRSDRTEALTADELTPSAAGCSSHRASVKGAVGPVKRLRSPRGLAAISPAIVAPGFGPIQCDARIVPNVEYLARRYRVRVTACYGIHSLNGEHPLGAAIDVAPVDGNWNQTLRLARALGWRESCAANGLAPACARPPFRAILYNGFPNHGDPAHCVPCAGGEHLHLSWHTSASQGEPENAARFSYFAPAWIDVFTVKPRGRDA